MDNALETGNVLRIDLYDACNRIEELNSAVRPHFELISDNLKAITDKENLNFQEFNEKIKVIQEQLNKIDWDVFKNLIPDNFQDSIDAKMDNLTSYLNNEDWETGDETTGYTRAKKVVVIYSLDLSAKRILKLMSNAISRYTCRIQQLSKTIFHTIFILFGMCSSRPRYIYAAIFGNSSIRVFS